MIKPRNVTFAGALGFVLSFLISIFSTHNFGRSLLRGLIFFVVFAILDAAVSMISEKFLDMGSDNNPLAGVGVKKTENNDAARKTTGTKVDITLSDDSLTDDGDSPRFAVGSNKKSISSGLNRENETLGSFPSKASSVDPLETVSEASVSSGISSGQKETVESSPSRMEYADELKPLDGPAFSNNDKADKKASEIQEFKPITLGTPINDSAAQDSASKTDGAVPLDGAAARKAQAKAEREAGIKEVGSLPDIGSFAVLEKSEESEDVIEDSDFAIDGEDISFKKESSGADYSANKNDASTMAKAIRTLLNKE